MCVNCELRSNMPPHLDPLIETRDKWARKFDYHLPLLVRAHPILIMINDVNYINQMVSRELYMQCEEL